MAQQDISIADYLAAERAAGEGLEYYDGIVRPRDPQRLDHSTIMVNLTLFLHATLGEAPHHVFSSDMRVQLSPTCIVYPDVALSVDNSMGGTDDVLLTPLLAMEIFTPESVAFDLGQKARYYRACPTIQEYLLIDCERPFVHVQRRAADGLHWEQQDYRDDEAVALRCVNIVIPMAAIYRDVRA